MENFIHTFQVQDDSICDALIEYHKNNTETKDFGYTGSGKHTRIDKSIKDSIDVVVPTYSKDPSVVRYHNEVISIGVEQYRKKYEFCNMPLQLKLPMNIQHYPIGGGYKSWHYERNSYMFDELSRVIVYMTYLNDLDNAGTEWLYQKYKVEAKKGLTVMWPAEWTHTHRGVVSTTQEKYIATGWLNMSVNQTHK